MMVLCLVLDELLLGERQVLCLGVLCLVLDELLLGERGFFD